MLNADGHGLPDADRGRRIDDGELNDGGLLLERSPPALEGKLHRGGPEPSRGGLLGIGGVCIAIIVRFDPKRRRIDDLEQQILSLHHLTRDDAGDCDHAVDRCAQRLGLDSGCTNDLTATAQAFKFDLRFDHQALQGDTAFRELAQSFQLGLGDRDELLKLTRPLGNSGAVCDRHRRLNQSEDVAFGDGLSEPGKPISRRSDASAIDALDDAAAVWIGDDAADENQGSWCRVGFCDHRADVEEALHRLRHVNCAIRQPSRCIAGRDGFGLRIVGMVVAFVSLGPR